MLGEQERVTLRAIAADSIREGLARNRPLAVDLAAHLPALRAPAATFVTLEIGGDLRGCIGTLEAHRALAADVAHNAFSAAFRDPRFAPVSPAEAPLLELHVSVLSAPEPLYVRDEEDLLARLEPGVDGLVLGDGPRRGTFLPSVWEQLPDPRDFVRQLKRKAGLPPQHWSATMRIERYRVEAF